MNYKNSIEIRLLTIPWCTFACRDFNLTNIGQESSFAVDKGTVLFACKATQNGNTGHLVFNMITGIYTFWPDSNNNIHEYLTLKEKSFSWREDIALLQGKKEEFTLEIGSKG